MLIDRILQSQDLQIFSGVVISINPLAGRLMVETTNGRRLASSYDPTALPDLRAGTEVMIGRMGAVFHTIQAIHRRLTPAKTELTDI